MNEITTPIAMRSLHDELVVALREMILNGDLEAGSRVDERALCERFGVSRTPLREALKVLATGGFVTLVPRRGARVSVLSEEELNEAFPVMAVLEALAGETACSQATDDEIAEIVELTGRMADHHRAEEIDGYFDLNLRIHLAIARAARNQTLWRMQRSLDGILRRGRFQANISRDRWNEAMAEHVAIAEALVARDGPRTAQLLRDHIDNTSRVLTLDASAPAQSGTASEA
jgi:DNA-binding GntR family transcriptional regulator